MNFCPNCDNLLYLMYKDTDGSVERYCKNQDACGFEPVLIDGVLEVSSTMYSHNDDLYGQYSNNKYLRYDPTIPRVIDDPNVACSNPQCTRAVGESQRVIYVKYDTVNMKYFYSCEYCGKPVKPVAPKKIGLKE